MELNNEIDSTAEVDSRKFWKMVNNRKKRQTPVSAGINFVGSIVRDRDLIIDGWYSYIKDLYSPSDDNNYDATFENVISSNLNDYVNTLLPDTSAIVLPEVVSDAIAECSRVKSCGYDKIQYEHLIYAKDILAPVLANIFTCMLRTAFVPESLKRGVIVTLHKGGNKRKDNPDN